MTILENLLQEQLTQTPACEVRSLWSASFAILMSSLSSWLTLGSLSIKDRTSVHMSFSTINKSINH